MIISKKLLIKGLVQGVGFRPAIYRAAINHGVTGTVENNNKGVIIIVEGEKSKVERFINNLHLFLPAASRITSIDYSDLPNKGFDEFKIIKSTSITNEVTEVSPDIATCDECIEDMKTQQHRLNYPFTNCTNCGPRFTIIRGLPYDRPKTTMDVFPMCEVCKEEYTTILNRRFHAQPVACNNCGPQYSIELEHRSKFSLSEITTEISSIIERGGIIAIKGMGGFHLACDAFNEDAIVSLRKIKNRDGKPLALMFKDLESAKRYFHISSIEINILSSWRKPILLLKNKKDISASISRGLDRSGVMLPYMPFHYLLFEKLKTDAIVLTSGNISDEPIVIDNYDAVTIFKDRVDKIVTYNRDIYNRTDDSVVKVISEKERLIRRSRGYAPSPIDINLNTEGIFSAGAELVNCFAIGKGNQIIMSQHIGDLKNLETLDFYRESIERYYKLFRFKPELVVRDLHPDYLSSKFCDQFEIPVITVQHHHAHIASCMAENRIDEKVIGISFDGTGLGDDNNIWGGEFFVCDLANYERINHFEYIPQPGGDAVTKHPWRMMTSYLLHYFGEDYIKDNEWLFAGINKDEVDLIINMVKKGINSPKTSSAGRLFDATSALLKICTNATYHAEAPMQLESASSITEKGYYNYSFSDHVCFKSTFAEMIDDISNNIDNSIIGGKFHNTIVNVISELSKIARGKFGINKVVLSGGTFQNSILLEKSLEQLKKDGFDCYSQSEVPSNDGGLALGQLAIAAKRRSLKLL